MSEASMDFVSKFLADYDKYGIQDFYNQTSKKMETSWFVKELVDAARKIAPVKVGRLEAANLMRAMDEQARVEAIEASPEKVVNLRAEFSRRTAENGGLRAILRDVVENPNAETVATARQFLEFEDNAE